MIMITTFAGSPSVCAQGELVRKSKVAVEGNFIEMDPLGNCYVVKDYEIKKYTPEGVLEFTYSNFITGRITSVDPSDPFKIIVFYQDFGQINTLDNTLSETGDPILLHVYGFDLASLVCRSYNSGLWIFDPQNFELIRFDDNMMITDRTGNINQVMGVPIDPGHLAEESNMVYLSDPVEGILSFDRYGTYYRTYPFGDLITFQVAGQRIIFMQNDEIHYYDTRKMLQSTMKLPVTGAMDAKIGYDVRPEQLFILDKAHLYIFVQN